MTENTLRKSTQYTIPEQDQAKNASESRAKLSPKYNIALFHDQMSSRNRLYNCFGKGKVSVYQFETLEQLHQNNCRYHPDIIFFAVEDDLSQLIKLIHDIKSHPTLHLIPLVVYTPDPAKNDVMELYEIGVDEIFMGEWDAEIINVKLKALCFRSKRDIGTNPSSGLPGASAIEADVEKRIVNNEDFAVCYVDLDNFKAYNDYYGYVYGDKVIRMAATIIRDTVFDLVKDGFVGHIGGDDFVFIVPNDKAVIVCENIIAIFDKMIIAKYEEADIEKGFIKVANRAGKMERFPIMTISIAVFPRQKINFTHLGEISHMMADLKKYAKSFPGSNYRIERRAKY